MRQGSLALALSRFAHGDGDSLLAVCDFRPLLRAAVQLAVGELGHHAMHLLLRRAFLFRHHRPRFAPFFFMNAGGIPFLGFIASGIIGGIPFLVFGFVFILRLPVSAPSDPAETITSPDF